MRRSLLLMAGLCVASIAAMAAPPAGNEMKPGSYECWGNGSARPLMNFTAKSGGKYIDSESKTGTYTIDPKNHYVTFKGGMLDGVLPKNFHAEYKIDRGRPKVSFIGSGGAEAQFCEWVK